MVLIEKMVELMSFEESNDEIAQEFLIHMKILEVKSESNVGNNGEAEDRGSGSNSVWGGLVGESLERKMESTISVAVEEKKKIEDGNKKENGESLKFISTMDVALAFHSNNQDLILNSVLPNQTQCDWQIMKSFGIPMWIKDLNKLKQLIEFVAKTEYKQNSHQFVQRVNNVALYYLALNKKRVLLTLYKNEKDGKKIFEFISKDFNQQR
jgi:hypothetical protein